jgi:light-regulated signal transduction histidine kinase (bacteriophytochrome)
LWISVLPDAATQLHMVFGSIALFDNHFNIAHALKITAYGVPCIGLILDYVRTYHDAEGAFVDAEHAFVVAKKASRDAENKEAELQRANDPLTHSNKELDEFAYIASHDLKEPLRGIHNYATFPLEDYEDVLDDDGQAKLRTLTRLTQRLDGFLDALLHYSRTGRIELTVVTTPLDDVVQDVLSTLEATLAGDGIEIRVPRPLPSVECDPVRAGKILRNLATNAAKYNDKHHKWVEIGYRSAEQGAGGATQGACYVRDNGIGIREKHHETIFRIFKRLYGRDAYGGGTGAGLSIVKKLVERHGGRIWVESVSGEGTTFWFTFGARATETQDEPELRLAS